MTYEDGVRAAAEAVSTMDVTTIALFARGTGNGVELFKRLAMQRISELDSGSSAP